MTNQKPTSCPSVWGYGYGVACWRHWHRPGMGSPSGRLHTSIHYGILGAWERPARKMASPHLELRWGMLGFQWRLVSRCVLGYSAASDAASSRWAMHPPRV